MNIFPGLQPADLGHHLRQQSVGSDVEGDAEKGVRAALIKLAAEFAVRHIELEKAVTRRQGHLVDLTDIPGIH